jgi:hypothetical protein
MTATTDYETVTGDRSITYRWDTGKVVTNHGEDARVVAELHVSHYGPRKQFTADFRNSEVGAVFVRTKFTIGQRSAFSVSQPVARYSQKGLTDFATRALTDLLTRHTAGDEGITAVFNGSAA